MHLDERLQYKLLHKGPHIRVKEPHEIPSSEPRDALDEASSWLLPALCFAALCLWLAYV